MNEITLQTYIKDKKYIFWYIRDISELSDEAIVEGIIKYGTWEDMKMLIKDKREILDKNYKNIISKSRCNLNKREINFINNILSHV
ncbi:MAG: hypothetical protein PHS92_04615 [Candidatus Gracilibacteria bacterium]|nr:hypothetical protein [Candidatus Gracilibacteria bacterium]